MANQEIIKITIDDSNGAFDVDLTGFHGVGCDAIIKAFGEIGEVKRHVHKSEFNAPMRNVQKLGK